MSRNHRIRIADLLPILLIVGAAMWPGCSMDRNQATAPQSCNEGVAAADGQVSDPGMALPTTRALQGSQTVEDTLATAPATRSHDLASSYRVVEVVAMPVEVVVGRGSKSVTQAVVGQNILKQDVWKYFERVNWSFNGSTVIAKSRTRGAEIYAPLWVYNGHIGSTESGGLGQSYYDAWTQGKFTLHFPWSGGPVIQQKLPWIEIVVRGNGTYSTSWGG